MIIKVRQIKLFYDNVYLQLLLELFLFFLLQELNLAVVGSQIVGLVPLQALMETADHYMNQSNLFILEEDQKLRLVCIEIYISLKRVYRRCS